METFKSAQSALFMAYKNILEFSILTNAYQEQQDNPQTG